MSVIIKDKTKSGELLPDEIAQEITETLRKCYNCKKCISGCPAAEQMDFPPAVVLKWLALGDFEKALRSDSIWLCTSCQSCYSRCPFNINIPVIMDLLKEYAVKNNLSKRQRSIRLFHKIFLSQVKSFGRIHELSLIGRWKIFSGHWFSDMLSGAKMFVLNKLSFLPDKIKKKDEITEMFKN